MTDINPYQSPASELEQLAEKSPTSAAPLLRRLKLAVYLIVAVYPLLVLLVVYALFLLAWNELGHLPRCSLDDPKGIQGIRDIYAWVGWMAISSPLVAVVCSGLVLVSRRPTVICMFAAAVAIYILLFCFDPLHAFCWFMD